MNPEELATAIFNWFDRPSSEDDDVAYTFNPDREKLLISVDGEVDCRKLAAAILKAIPHK